MTDARMRRFVCALVAALALAGMTSLAITGEVPFELDGNAILNGGEDWETVNFGGGSSIVHTGVLPDMHTAPADPSAFFNKQTKDTVDIPGNWTYKATSVPDKDDISNAYAAAYVPTSGPRAGHTIFVFGADRFSSGNGDAFLGFWFFQENVAPVPGGTTFAGKHQPGDILVLVNFQGGGSTPAVQVLEWVASGGDVDTHLNELYSSANALCAPGDGDACAITNANPITLFWPFAYKGQAPCPGPQCTAPALAFFEGAIDLSAIFPAGSELPCITSFLAETRSSSSPGADLKDFVASKFELCAIGIGKACVSQTPAGSTVTYVNSVTVTNEGSGRLYDALVTDTYPTGISSGNVVNGTRYYAADCTGFSPCIVVPGLANIPPGGTVTFPETFSLAAISATDSVTVAARPSLTGERTVTAGPAAATCEATIQSSVQVTKNCNQVRLVAAGGVVKVEVSVSGTVTNNSPSTADIEILSITDSKFSGAIVPSQTTLAQGQVATFGPLVYYPSAVDSPVCTAGSNCFTDTVTVTWRSILTGVVGTPVQAAATCALCPTCPPCSPLLAAAPAWITPPCESRKP